MIKGFNILHVERSIKSPHFCQNVNRDIGHINLHKNPWKDSEKMFQYNNWNQEVAPPDTGWAPNFARVQMRNFPARQQS